MEAPEVTDIHEYLKQHEQKQLMRFITCGSVDDGKSTLIGRMLYDSKMVYEDQLATVRKDSKKHGTTADKGDRDFDPALLTDGLRAEREQGITIDVAYRYFSTKKRKFIIADTPGHEQYTRNMATGASTADLAIILIDARHGVQTQTRRHSFIASLLGIKHVVVAINKMDLVGFSQEVFEKIKADYTAFVGKLDLPDIRFVPMSALDGDNVVNESENTPWYEGGTMMHILETVYIGSDRNLVDMRFPVQLVTRPNLDFRGFAGTLASGVVRPGDEVTVLPSRKTTTIKEVLGPDGPVDEAFAPMSATLTFDDEVDASRGDMIVRTNNQPQVAQAFEAMLVWMDDQPLETGRGYLVKHTTRQTPGQVTELRYRVDVNTLASHDSDTLKLNEIGRVVVEVARPVAFDPYSKNRGTGAFILIDRMTHRTVAAGMILDRATSAKRAALEKISQGLATSADQHRSLVSDQERRQRLKQSPATVWLTGLTGSGKSTLAWALERRLFDEGHTVFTLDGRSARLGLSNDLTFSEDDRRENLRRAAEVAKMANRAGLITICSFLSPAAADREEARQIIGAERFLEVHVDAPEAACRERAEGKGSNMAAFSDMAAPYEPPASPDLRLSTAEDAVEACVERMVHALRERGALSAGGA
ncbi:sulfate adenylyltransferase subunit CysN [Phycisphaera mikurensis]|uniref:Sulfate adenylyltransferase subunit 1 n=1 Tax=Phycisphaera mikurensis (strain NBRC 102666 / KCTC 22515 / FYK2301M01) TaxID=1142394 RepID=I0IH56_PHYMF|nr:sulfate adenylyltransferase subunit CysN [Phycisphaera mikurensis]MBB6440846.1 bifunctional enzyme CysN/CysC [Phycisphaera mikurensis]BAM04594.1 sulfate adenylyltransferase subunit 1/adenylyl-sulfate kinase [Phycisphaera mikurensis NBRC 102666]